MSTISEQVYRAVKAKLIDGELKPGQRFSQRKLAAEMGCSPLPVLEAVRRLESDGVLKRGSRRMVRVRELSLEDLEGLYLVREAFERVAAQLCARRITDLEVAELRELGRRFEAAVGAGNVRECIRAEASLHRFIGSCARCPFLSEELDRFLVIELATSGERRMPDPATYRQSHRAIIEAIADHDEDLAEYLMRKHIRGAYSDALEEGLTRWT